MISATIPGSLPSLNKLLRMHWAERRKIQKAWDWDIWVSFLPRADGLAQGKKKVRLTIRRSRLLDHDNAASYAKVICDSLKKARMLVDDSPNWCAPEWAQERCLKGQDAVVVEVSDAD